MSASQKMTSLIYRWLAQRELCSREIELKLIKKGFFTSDISSVINNLQREGIISDQRFAASYIRYRQSRGYGPLRIRQELQARGLTKEMIEDQLDIADNAWFVEAQRAWQKRFRGKLPFDLKERAQQLRFLQYRGFTQEHIDSIFDG